MNKAVNISIADRLVGKDYSPLVIAEIGINHSGNIEKAKQMVDDAKDAGCECVKFQCHIIEDEMIPEAGNVIPGNSKESILDIMKSAVLTEAQEKELKKYVETKGMIYISTPFSRAAADRLEKMGVKAYKIGSGECNNYPLVEYIASFGKPVILSTGMNDINSIKKSVNILREKKVPFALMHCTSIYPTPYDKVRLGALEGLSNEFPDAVIGLSDHSIGNFTCFGAVALGASILEKHFVSDKRWKGPDVSISLLPLELKELINGCEAIYKSMYGENIILPEEKITIDFAYSSIVSIKDIKKGDVFNKDNLWVKRPGTGDFPASDYNRILGKKAKTNITKDKQIKKNMVEL